jgi:signal transduction histidine kinase
MRSLFLKIFLWFGVAMVLVQIASFVTGIVTERRSQPQRNNPMAQTFAVYAQTAVEIFERDGKAALTSFLDRVEGASHLNGVLLDEHGNEVSGRTPPVGAMELASRVTEETSFLFEFPKPQQKPLGAQVVRGPKGARYVLVAELPRPGFMGPPRLGEPGSLFFGLRIIARSLLPLLLIGGLFCYWLARYLSAPIVTLRGATHELSDGNLTARVDSKLLKRHDEVGYLGRDFNIMAGRIESLVAAQRRLLGDISHELRSPLARQGVALGLARRRGNPEVTSSLDRIGREAERMNEMIGQLLSLSQLESGTDSLSTAVIDLAALVREVADDADFEARSRERTVRIVASEDCTVSGVSDLLRSAIENVVRNAVRHTAQGTEVAISLRCEDSNGFKEAVVSVQDHGKGVPEEAIEEIFRAFYRVEHARDRKTGGTGLGLAIAARAVRLHGGTIKAANVVAGGLIVEIRLPRERQRD